MVPKVPNREANSFPSNNFKEGYIATGMRFDWVEVERVEVELVEVDGGSSIRDLSIAYKARSASQREKGD